MNKRLAIATVWLGARALLGQPEPMNAEGFEYSREFLKLVPDPSAVERVSTGHRFVEGPTWVPFGHALVFSDIPKSQQHALYVGEPGEEIAMPEQFGDALVSYGREATTRPSVRQAVTRPFRVESHQTNGTALARDGSLIACQGGARNVAKVTMDGKATVLADRFDGKRFNSPNDVTVAHDDAIYFTDPRYGRIKEGDLEIDHFGVYRIGPDGAVSEVIEKGIVAKPNGIALSPDDATLYVADTDAKPQPAIWAFKLAGGKASDGRVIYRMPKGVPDGIRIDSAGNIWSSAGDGIHVLTPAGQLLGIIKVPEVPSNLTFGGAHGTTLFITAQTSVYVIETSAKGCR